MHSLSLKVFTDLNAGTRGSCFPRRVCHGLAADLDFGRRRMVGSGCWDGVAAAAGGRKCWVVACAVERNGNAGNGAGGGETDFEPKSDSESEFVFTSHPNLCNQQMEVAAKSEHYKEAVRIRDSLKMSEEEEPVLRFRRLIKEAAANDRFEDAAR